MNDLQSALLHANPALSRFDPLDRILFLDDFDRGMCGWSQLIGNYEHTLDSLLPGYRDLRPPQLSNLTMWDTGTAGSMDGTYALKLATRPRKDSLSVAIKRQTFRHYGKLQLEAYVCFKPEASELRLLATDVRAFGVGLDIQDGYHNQRARWMPHLRYLNAVDGERIGQWQTRPQSGPVHDIGNTGETVSHFHLSKEGWVDVPNGHVLTMYNEIATKMNWSYLKVGVDLQEQRFTGFKFDDNVYPADGMTVITLPPFRNVFAMLNVFFWVEADTDKRAFLYVDSVLLSGELA